MPSVEKLLEAFRENPRGVRFADAHRVCTRFFGEPRVKGSTTCSGLPRPATHASIYRIGTASS